MLFSDADFESVCKICRLFGFQGLLERKSIYMGYDTNLSLIKGLDEPVKKSDYLGSPFVLPYKSTVIVSLKYHKFTVFDNITSQEKNVCWDVDLILHIVFEIPHYQEKKFIYLKKFLTFFNKKFFLIFNYENFFLLQTSNHFYLR